MKPLKHFVITTLFVLSFCKLNAQARTSDKYFSSTTFVVSTEIFQYDSENEIIFNFKDNKLSSVAIKSVHNDDLSTMLMFIVNDTGIDLTAGVGEIHRVYECLPLNEFTKEQGLVTQLSIDRNFKKLVLYGDTGMIGGYILDYLK